MLYNKNNTTEKRVVNTIKKPDVAFQNFPKLTKFSYSFKFQENLNKTYDKRKNDICSTQRNNDDKNFLCKVLQKIFCAYCNHFKNVT